MTSALKMGVGGQHHAQAALPPGKTQYPSYRRLGGPRGRSVRVRKISPPPGSIPGPSCPWRVATTTELSLPLFKYFRDLNAATKVYAGLLVYRHVSKPLLTVAYVRVATNGHGFIWHVSVELQIQKCCYIPVYTYHSVEYSNGVSQFCQKIQKDYFADDCHYYRLKHVIVNVINK